ncbi:MULTISPECIES: hypothetical protein [Flavobacterium]|uniref:hypothetical protein n=1 Tax=Flavobacterium TaxID=237 RepID=UPI001FCAD000|nr:MULTISPECIES: hypothetical protein [Flavobacterium]UOK43466.1 hypothetical protein LZF87_04925 [Flavobacterium enshiense]
MKSQIHFIPNHCFEQLNSTDFFFKGNDVDEDLLCFLKEKNLVFDSNEDIRNCFPQFNDDFEIPYDIITAVVELSEINALNLYKFNENGVNGQIPQFNFIFSEYTTVRALELFSDFVNENEADTFEVTLVNGFELTEMLFKLLEPSNKIISINNFSGVKIIDGSNKKNRFYNDIDEISLKISPNLLTYFESAKCHVYFNRKLFIGKDSEIKNVFETVNVFGYLKDLSNINIKNLISLKGLNEFWEVKKDDTFVCSDCEFRRLCVDNRVPIRGEGKWKYNTECNYNPYISKWQHEEGYASLSECGVRSDLNEFYVDSEKINRINSQLWDE